MIEIIRLSEKVKFGDDWKLVDYDVPKCSFISEEDLKSWFVKCYGNAVIWFINEKGQRYFPRKDDNQWISGISKRWLMFELKRMSDYM